MASASDPAAPLDGIVVIEIGHSVAAPFAGQVLGDLGATVVKIEAPGGDDARRWGPPFFGDDAATFHAVNRNKRSVVIDLTDEADRARLLGLMAGADVVIQNMRPGLTERYGVGDGPARAANPRLVYCNLGAFGRDGPLHRATGYDPLVQAFSGIMSVTGHPDTPPARVGPSIVDQGTGMWCVIGILAALLARAGTGRGCTVDASLYETALSWMTIPIANGVASGRDPGKSGSETPMLAPYAAYRARDRHLMLAAGNNNLFRRLAQVLGTPEWAEDARFRDNADRVRNRKSLNALIEERTLTQDADHWIAAMDAVGVPCAAVQTVSEVLAHPQTAALGILQGQGAAQGALVGLPLSFDGRRPVPGRPAPSIGGGDDDPG